MDYVETSKAIVAQIKSVMPEYERLKAQETSFITAILKSVKAEILKTQNEDDLLKLGAQVADDFYAANGLVEQFDGLIAFYVLKAADKLIFDKFFGKDWYLKFRAFVESL